MNLEKLNAKVMAVNAAHKAVNAWRPKLIEFFKQYVGQKIFKADGWLVSRIELKVPKLDGIQFVSCYFDSSRYSLRYVAKSCVGYGHTCVYYEATMWIGDMEDGFLKKVYDFEPVKDDYTVEGAVANIKAVEAAKKALDEANSALQPFQENDCWR